MKRKVVSVEDLAIVRYQLLIKGFCNQKEVGEFVPCGYKKSKEIITNIRSQVQTEGYENLDGSSILTKRIVHYLGLTEKQIINNYQEIKKAQSPTKAD